MKSYTDIEQSRQLAEFLPLESADMYWFRDDTEIPKIYPKNMMKDSVSVTLPCWSLTALLELIPSNVFLYSRLVKWDESYYMEKREILYDNPVDAVFEIICWLKENNKL